MIDLELVEPYGGYDGYPLVPNRVLYDWLEANRNNLVNESQLGLDHLPQTKLGKEVIRRSKSDLMWLARYFCWRTSQVNPSGDQPIEENLIDEQYYQPLIDLFVKKDGTKPISKQSEIKTRLLLWPRSGLKSTLDHIDACQWILNWPDIRILYLTAEASLAKGFVGELKAHFQIREGDPTWMNLFFPSYCFDVDKEAANVFTCPIWAAKKTKRKEATVTASSVGKHKAGRHYQVIKADDAVSDVNTTSSEQCATISEKLFLAEKLLDLGGYYVDYIGTRYHEVDHYGVLLDKHVGAEIISSGQGWTLSEDRDTATRILIGRACQIKPEVAEQLERDGRAITYHEAGPEGCVLLLPHIMSFAWCLADFTKNEKTFEGQRNQNPRTQQEIEFTRPLLKRCTVPYTDFPAEGPISIVWDFAFSKQKGRDYSTACVVLWGEDAEKNPIGHICEVMRGRFNQATLAKAVVDMAVKWRPFVIGVENAGGSELLTQGINFEAARTGNDQVIAVCSRIEWFKVDSQKGAKEVRMRALYPWMLRGGLKFASHCMAFNQPPHNNMEVLYSEFEKCLASHHHEDIPDVIAQQFRLYAPKGYLALSEGNLDSFGHSDPSWNLIFCGDEGVDAFGRLGYGPAAPTFLDEVMEEDSEVRADPYQGMPAIFGVGIAG